MRSKSDEDEDEDEDVPTSSNESVNYVDCSLFYMNHATRVTVDKNEYWDIAKKDTNDNNDKLETLMTQPGRKLGNSLKRRYDEAFQFHSLKSTTEIDSDSEAEEFGEMPPLI